MSEAARLSVTVDANVGGAQRGLLGVQRSALGAAKSMAKFAAASAGLAGVGAAVAGVVKTTVDFDKSMRNVNSIAQLNEGQFKKLSASVKDLAGPTAQAPKTLADGLYDLVSSGFDAKQSLTILKSSARAATAGLTDTATSTKAVAAVLNAYHRPAAAAAAVSDDLFQTVKAGVITFEELASNIGDVLPFAAALGVNLKQVGAATATMTKAGVSAPETMTRIKATMSALIKPSDDLKKAYKALGVASGEELIKKTGSLQGALQTLERTTGGSKEALSKLFPDIRALGGALLLTGANAKGASAELATAANASGATSATLKEQAKSVSFAWQQFKATMAAAAIDVGSGLVPAMAAGAQAAAKFISEIRTGTGDGGKFAAGASQVASTVASIVSPAASAASAVGRLGVALASTRSGLGLLTGAATGFAAFKLAGAAAPSVMKLASAMSFLVLNARTAPTIGAFFASAGAAAGPVGIAAAAFVALGAAVGYALSRESEETQIAHESAAAKRAQIDAINALHSAEGDTVDKQLAAKRATLDVRDAEKALHDVRKNSSSSRLDVQKAEQTLAETVKRSADAHSAYRQQLGQTAAAEGRVRDAANGRLAAAQKELMSAKVEAGFNPGDPGAIQRVTAAQEAYNKAMRDFGNANRVASISALNQKRIAAGVEPITRANAAGYQFLAAVMQKMPKSIKTKFLLSGDQAALASMGNLSAQLIGMGRRKTVARILADANSAKAATLAFKAILAGVPLKTVAKILANTSGEGEVNALVAAIGRVQSKTVSIITRLQTIGTSAPAGGAGGNKGGGPAGHGYAAGRGVGGAEAAMVAEDGYPEWVGNRQDGWKLVSAPSIVNLSARDSVIPTDPARAARAAMLAANAGFPSYAGGKDGAVSQVQTSTNPFTKKRERHTAKEWARIRARYKAEKDARKKAAKAKKDARADRLSNPMSLVNLDTASVGVAAAGLTADSGDDRAAFSAQSTAVAARLKKVKAALGRKGLKRADRRRLLGEQASLLGQQGSIAESIKGLSTSASATQFAQAGVATAGLTADLGDDVTAARTLVGALTTELQTAQATGDPTKIAEAANNLKGASDQLDNASQAVRDAATKTIDDKIRAFGGDVIRAKVSGNTGDEIAAVTKELATATDAYNAAAAANNLDGIEKYGGEVLSLRSDLKTLNDSIGSLTETMQAQLDLSNRALEDARRALNTSAAEQRAMGKYLVGIVNQQVGQMVGRRSGTPRPLALSSY